MEAVLRGLVTDLECGVALHAGAVAADGKSILIAGPTGAGKSTLTAWLVQNGFDYLTDELTVLARDGTKSPAYFARPLTIRADAKHVLDEERFRDARRTVAGDKILFAGLKQVQGESPPVGLILFPRFQGGSDLRMSPLSGGPAALRLLENNLNGRNLDDGGLRTVADLAEQIPALSLVYGDDVQLEGVADVLVKHVLETGLDAKTSHAVFSPFVSSDQPGADAGWKAAAEKLPVNEPTPSRGKFRLTIGMATYDDYDGVYFTVQSLRMNNAALMDQIELLIVDNHPDGACGADLKALENISPNLRYVPFFGQSGTAVRDFIFAQASGDFVLCLDCHVLLVPGALQHFIEYIEANPQASDLLQGPLVYDGLEQAATHFEPVWRKGMYGIWADSVEPPDPASEPFEILMQGLGLFACRRDRWPGFNTRFKGFGGEEGYIHEKFRQQGDRTLCLPFLQWVHRFSRPMGVPYGPSWKDRIRNYTIGFRELDLDTAPIRSHFDELIGAEETQQIIEAVETELDNPFNRFGAIYCINMDSEQVRWAEITERFRHLGIDRLVSRFPAVATPGNHHIGCALSHRAIIQQARQRGLSDVLVFEDDAIFHADIADRIETVLGELEKTDWDLFYLGGHNWGKQYELVPGRTSLECGADLTSAHAIAYNHTIFDLLLAELPEDRDGMEAWLATNHGIDQFFYRLDANKLLSRPMLVMQPVLLPVLSDEQQSRFRM